MILEVSSRPVFILLRSVKMGQENWPCKLSPGQAYVFTNGWCRLVLGDPNFATQFVNFGGLDSQIVALLLQERNSASVLVDALLIISQLARSSSEYYEKLHQADPYSAFKV